MDLGDENLWPLRLLGEGTFGRVFLCKCHKNNQSRHVCVKRIIVQNPKLEMKMLQEEVYIISQLRHPNIVKFIRSFVHAGTVNIVMEYLSNGTIRDIIDRSRSTGGIPKSSIIHFLLDMLMGLEYLHIRRITHRDIKPENLLIDENGRIKYADFGISGIHHPMTKQQLKSTGSPLYTAPEVLHADRFYFKSDIWSLGCVLYEMCVGCSPFATATTLMDLEYLIRTMTRPRLQCIQIYRKYGSVLSGLCEQMIAYNMQQRISLPDVIRFDYSITLPFYKRYFDYSY